MNSQVIIGNSLIILQQIKSYEFIISERSAIRGRYRIRQAEGRSLQTMANRLNEEGVPTLSGRGHWQKGTIANLLAQGA